MIQLLIETENKTLRIKKDAKLGYYVQYQDRFMTWVWTKEEYKTVDQIIKILKDLIINGDNIGNDTK